MKIRLFVVPSFIAAATFGTAAVLPSERTVAGPEGNTKVLGPRLHRLQLASAQSGGSLCRADEVPFFQCRIGRKRVSVCGVRVDGEPVAKFRMGTALVAKIQHISSAASPLTWSRSGYSGGGEVQYALTRKGVEYRMFDRTIRVGRDKYGRSVTRFESGLVVFEHNRVFSKEKCDGTFEAGQSGGDPSKFMKEGRFMDDL